MQPGVVIVESVWPNRDFEGGIGINALTSDDPAPPDRRRGVPRHRGLDAGRSGGDAAGGGVARAAPRAPARGSGQGLAVLQETAAIGHAIVEHHRVPVCLVRQPVDAGAASSACLA